ncbi:MAG: M23 family metallopeptidase [Clostridiales bacterium]|nr:M23 family metallopeptidase [Candidatus Cacconaster stercorequi]
MSKFNDNKTKSAFGGRGFYIALAFCLVAAGVIGYFTILRPIRQVSQTVSPAPVVQQPQQQATVTVQQPEEKPEPEPETAPEETTPQVEDLLPQVMSPLDGTTVTVFSTTELMYDETMADWRTHDGVDIQAAEGDSVKTAANGKVTSVKNDELMGTTVVIEHAGGYATTYSSLQENPPVSEGQQVSAGDIIGTVGNTAAAETDMGAHLHFSVSKDGATVNPDEYIGK